MARCNGHKPNNTNRKLSPDNQRHNDTRRDDPGIWISGAKREFRIDLQHCVLGLKLVNRLAMKNEFPRAFKFFRIDARATIDPIRKAIAGGIEARRG